MKLSKAIEILSLEVLTTPLGSEQDFNNALKLGIEALELHQQEKSRRAFPYMHLLPSETE